MLLRAMSTLLFIPRTTLHVRQVPSTRLPAEDLPPVLLAVLVLFIFLPPVNALQKADRLPESTLFILQNRSVLARDLLRMRRMSRLERTTR